MQHRRRDDYTPLGIYWLFLGYTYATKVFVTPYTNDSCAEIADAPRQIAKNGVAMPITVRQLAA
jgi:hypothetical protein